jgi:flagellar capping protein FliD
MKNEKGIDKLWKRFNEEVNDKELQRRFDGFKNTEKRLVEQHNELVQPINEKLSEKSRLEHVIVESAKLGILHTEAVGMLKSAEKELAELTTKIAKIDEDLENERRLIKKYEDGTEAKLFHYWGMLTALDNTIKPWISFKEDYRDKIF